MLSREYAFSGGVSLLLHLILLAWIASDFSSKPEILQIKVPQSISATLVELDPKDPPKVKKKEIVKPKEPEVIKKPETKALEIEKLKGIEKEPPKFPPPIVTPQIDLKAKALQEKKEKEAEQKRLEEKRRKEEEAIAEEQRKKEETQRRANDLLSEIEKNDTQADNQKEESAMSYIALIQRTIELNWSRPPSARTGMEVLLDIELIPTGEVRSVSIAKSSGNLAFDRSAVDAVEKAEQFPELAKLQSKVFEKNFRHFQLLFTPKDLRL